MRTLFTVALLLSLVACAGPRYSERTPPLPPPTPPDAKLPARQDTTPFQPINEAATKAFLEREVERNRYVPPPEPPVAIEPPVQQQPPGYYQDSWDQPYQYRPYYHYGSYGRDDYPTTFPLHTALGAGIGAVIGHQSGHRSEGAWIGGGLGLLLDLGSHW